MAVVALIEAVNVKKSVDIQFTSQMQLYMLCDKLNTSNKIHCHHYLLKKQF